MNRVHNAELLTTNSPRRVSISALAFSRVKWFSLNASSISPSRCLVCSSARISLSISFLAAAASFLIDSSLSLYLLILSRTTSSSFSAAALASSSISSRVRILFWRWVTWS